MVELAATIFADGPSSAPSQPIKPLIRDWGTWIEGVIAAFLGNGGLVYTSRASLFADLAHGANSSAWVIGDATTAYNGVYMKNGASGAGSWTRVSDLPFPFIIATDAGAGTPNAIQATSSIPVSGSALVWMNVFEANTASPVTVSFNGGSTLTIKTNSGNDIATGGLVAGMVIAGIISGSRFRLLSDQVSAAIVAAAEAAQAAAEAAAVSVNIKNVADRTALKALNTTLTTLAFLREAGREGLFKWTAGDFSTQIAADTAEGIYIKADAIASTSGAWVRQYEGGVDLRWFGAVGDGTTDNATAFTVAGAVATQLYIPNGTFLINVTGANYNSIFALLTKCNGPGTVDLYLATGIYNTAQFYGFVNAAPVNVNIRGDNLSGSLTAANVTFAGTAYNFTAAITFSSLPSGIAVGQLLSLVPTSLADKKTSLCLLAGANKITNIAGNVVTVAINYHGTVTALMPTIVGSISFTGAWRLNKSVINYTGSRTPIYVQSPLARVNLTDIGLSGPYSSGVEVNTSGVTIGWIDEDRHYVKDQVKLSGVGIFGFAYGVLGQGAKSALLDVRIAKCLYGVRGLRQSSFYATSLYVSNCVDSGISLEESSEIFARTEVISCGNGGRGVWAFSSTFNAPILVLLGYNINAGGYAKADGAILIGVNSSAFRNNNIGWGTENGRLHVDDSTSEYNLKSGYESGNGGSVSAQRTIAHHCENGYYALVGSNIFADDCESYSNSQNGAAAAELSHVRAYRGKFHDNAGAGVTAVGNSHVRADTAQINNNATYGASAVMNSSVRLPGVTGTGNTPGNTSYDATSTGTTW